MVTLGQRALPAIPPVDTIEQVAPLSVSTSVVPAPSDTFFMAECANAYTNSDHFHLVKKGYAETNFESQVAVTRHLNKANYLFVDGHVQALQWKIVRQKLLQQGSRFVAPAGGTP